MTDLTEAERIIRQMLAGNPDLRLCDESSAEFMADVSRRVGYDATAAVRRGTTEDHMQASEAEIQDAIIEALIYDGWLVLRVNAGAMDVDGERYVRFGMWQCLGMDEQDAGQPDLVAARDGRVLFIEAKRPDGGRQRKSQVRFMEACEQTGNAYVLARGVEDVAPWLTRVEIDTDD